MKRLFITYVFILFAVMPGLTQIVIIVDSEDLKPIPDVAILNNSKTKFIYTNTSGKADISAFSDEDIVCFRHFTYEGSCLTFDEIRKSGFEVSLTKKIFAIDEFVISANRWEQNINEVPNRITTIIKPSIELQNPQTAADLIGISEEVFIQKSQLGGGSPMIRGFATNRVLIVVDGVRMNNGIYREGNIQNVISLDPSSMESAEVIFGPGATIYGSDAIGGVMDFHTKKALLSTGESPYYKIDAMSRFSTADREKTFHLDFNAGTRKAAFLTSISWSDFDDLKMGSRKNPDYIRPEYAARIGGKDSIVVNPDPAIQVSSGYRQLNTMNKLRLKLSPHMDLVLANHYSRLSDVPRYDRLIQYKSGKLRYGDWYYGPQIWMMNNIQISIDKDFKLFDEAKLIAAQQNYEESRHDRSFGKNIMNEQTEQVLIFSLNLDFDKNLMAGDQLVYYGFEIVSNDISSSAQTRDIVTGDVTPAGSRYPNGDNFYNSFSLYGGYKNNLSEKFTVNTGVRYNFVSLSSTIADTSFYGFPFSEISFSNGALTGAAGIVLRVNDKLHLNLNTSSGFRAPNLDDAGKVFDSAPGIVVVPNPDLKPEYAYNTDLGISKDFGDVVHTEFTVYHSWLTNAMVRDDFLFNGKDSIMYLGELSKVEAVTNAGTARVYGLYFNVQVNLSGHFSLRSSLNINEGFEKNGDPLRHAAPLFGSTHLVYNSHEFRADLSSDYNGAKKFEKMAPAEIEKPYMYSTDENGNPWSPGWLTLNLKMSYQILNRITVSAGAENIFDLRYRPYSSGIVAPGRNFIFSLRVNI
jgi:hemoglobin/transferrin/lactoferrin receptor protein